MGLFFRSDGTAFETKGEVVHREAIDLLMMGARMAAEKALLHDAAGETRQAVAQRYLKVKYINAASALNVAVPTVDAKPEVERRRVGLINRYQTKETPK